MDDSKILSQGEVDALLSAIDTGEVEVGVEPPAAEGPRVVPYDFRRPERVARDQLRAIGTLHEVFGRNFQAALSGLLRTIVEVRVQAVDQLTYSEFINSLPNPTIFNIVSVEPLEGHFILEINPVIAFPILERMLGSARGGVSQPERALTDLEWGLINTVVEAALERLRDAWSKVAALKLRVTEREANPQLVPIMSSNEPVVSVSMELVIGEARGFMNLCIPVISIESVLERVSAHTWFASRRAQSAPAQSEQVAASVRRADVELRAFLAEGPIEVGRLLNLQPGDRVQTPHAEQEPIVVCVEGRPKFLATFGEFKGRKAIKIVRALGGAETPPPAGKV
jgi:flagellar motor switch protein FliM